MKQFLEIIFVFSLVSLVVSTNFQYEKMQNMRRYSPCPRQIKQLLHRKTYEHPQPLPSSSSQRPLMKQPYPNLYQGARSADDRRVFRKQFNYPATPVGHQVLCHDLLDCDISFISVETKESIPIILRGGAGYRHFTVAVRANAWHPLEGTVRVYCRNLPEET